MGSTPPRRLRVLLVDDHAVVRAGLAQALGFAPDLEVCAEAATVAEALARARESRPDVAIVDLTLGRESGLEVLRGLKELEFPPAMLVLSMHDESFYADQAVALGARGYLMKSDADAAVVAAAVRTVAQGGFHLSERLRKRIVERALAATRDSPMLLERLSERERQVFERLARGLTSKEIAQELGSTAKTVDSHRRNIRLKLGVEAPEDLRRLAVLLAPGLSEDETADGR